MREELKSFKMNINKELREIKANICTVITSLDILLTRKLLAPLPTNPLSQKYEGIAFFCLTNRFCTLYQLISWTQTIRPL
jgi:hypothetical protein